MKTRTILSRKNNLKFICKILLVVILVIVVSFNIATLLMGSDENSIKQQFSSIRSKHIPVSIK